MRETAIRLLNSGGSPVTGQSANITVRYSPYATPGNVIGGLTVTEVGTQGNYVISGFGTTYYQLCKVYLSGVEQSSCGIQNMGDPAYGFVGLTGDQTVAGVKTFSSPPVSSTAATTANQLVRFNEAILTTGAQSKAGQLTFDSTGSIVPIITNWQTTGYPTNVGHLTSKGYVDSLFGAVIAPVQSSYIIHYIPARTADTYSKQTMEACNTYLSALSNITTRRGTIIIDAMEAASVSLDDGVSQWCSNGVDIFSFNKAKLVRRAPNPSLTSTTRIKNCYIEDQVAAGRAYASFTFDNCDIYFDGSGNSLTFTSCKFLGTNRLYAPGTTVNLTNCSGTSLYIGSTDVAISGTQPVDLMTGLDYQDLGF